MAMAAPAKLSVACTFLCQSVRLRTVSLAIFFFWVMLCGSARAQSVAGSGSTADSASSIRGRVLNRKTREAISRALVFSLDQRYATMTDDEGRFEFKFPPLEPEPREDWTATPDASVLRARQLRMMRNSRPAMFQARKPGFLEIPADPSSGRVVPNQPEVVIYLDPESLIVGHVAVPGLESGMRIRVELYRREMREGQEVWQFTRNFSTWADGEFRFSELPPGTYKLGTAEELDRDPLTFTPGGQQFGYPPVFFPAAVDFASASPIDLAEGTTYQANLSPVRHGYYPVKIPIANGTAAQPISVRVYPVGHAGPGYSLGYNSGEQLIQGMLPDGNYTLEALSQGQPGSTGFLNFSVGPGSSEGPVLNLVPNTALAVTVKEEFNSSQSVFVEDTPPPGGPSEGAGRRRANVQVMLMPVEEFGSGEMRASEPWEGSVEHTLVVKNVRPGRYRVRVQTGAGYAASIQSGGIDLLRQPLVMGMGGASSAIEVTLRDDGAEIEGKIDEKTQSFVYFVPLGEGPGQLHQAMTTPDGSFGLAQLPPGTYRVLAFDRQQDDLAYADAEAMRNLESKGQVVQLEAGQKEHLRLRIIRGGDAQ